jgi:hypothetical protein
MIIDEELTAGSSAKLLRTSHPHLRLPEPAARSSVSLPSYEVSEAQQRSGLVHFPKPSKSPFPNRFDSRFWRGTFFALAIYVFLSVVIGIPLIVTRIAARKSRAPPPNIQTLFLDDSDAAAPLNLGGGQVMAAAAVSCDVWDDKSEGGGLFTASARRILNPSGLFSVRSNATDEVIPRPGGKHNLTVGVNDDATETHVVMQMTLTASSPELRSSAHFCFAPAGDMRGFSVYMPRNLSETDYLTFDIRVLFPQSPKLLTATNFVTYLPMFGQYFGPISGSMRISSYNIAGAGVEIVCDQLQADKILVRNSFAPISGSFNVTQSLTLDNVEGPIHTNVTLVNDPSTNLATYLILDTGNSDVKADVTLVGTSKSQKPRFNGNVQTFNGTILLNVDHDKATPSSAITLQTMNNLAETQIYMDNKFTGGYDLRSKLAPVRVAHPHGMPSEWNMVVDSNSTYITRGWAGWGDRPTNPNPSQDSKVSAVSSLAPILLHLGT